MNHRILIPEQNIKDICLQYAKIANGQVSDADSLCTVFQSPGFFYTRNLLTEKGYENIEAAIGQVCAGRQEGRPSLTTFTEQLAPEGTKALFEKNGFELMLTQHGMVLESGFDVDPAVNPHITQIGEADIVPWVDTMMKGFAHEKEREDIIYENMIRIPDLHFLLYQEDGRLLGTTILQFTGTYAGLHEVSVDPAFQGRGIATKLVTRALQIAKDHGVCGITLQASDLGKPVYEKFGFQKVSDIHSMFIK